MARIIPRVSGVACFLAAFALFSFLSGCGGRSAGETGTLTGQVTHHGGKPLTDAKIFFVAAPLGCEGTADLAPDGKYEIKTRLKAGKYQIQITPPPVVDKADGSPPPKPIENRDIPMKVRSYATSGLSTSIKAGKNEYNIDLKD